MAEPGSELKPQTRAMFDVLIAQTKTKLSKEKLSKKGKRKTDDADISKEMLMESLAKETNDNLARANTYDPQLDRRNKANRADEQELSVNDETTFTKKPQRFKEKSRTFGSDNLAYDDDGERATTEQRHGDLDADNLDDTKPLKIEDLAAESPRKGVLRKGRSSDRKAPAGAEAQQPYRGSNNQQAGAATSITGRDSSAAGSSRRKKQQQQQQRRAASHDNAFGTADEAEQQADRSESRELPRDAQTSVGAERKKKKEKRRSKSATDRRLAAAAAAGEDDAGPPAEEMSQPAAATTLLTTEAGKGKEKKKKGNDKRRKKDDDGATVQDGQSLHPEVIIDPTSPLGKIYKYKDEGKVLGVVVHRTDKLKTDFFIMHPIVRVHLIDENTGKHLRKQIKNRPVTSYYESQRKEQTPEVILPVLTQPFDFKDNRAIVPNWEELLIFNENFNYLIQEDPKVIMFFEILDFVSMSRASRQSKRTRGFSKLVEGEGGWHKVAWGFLKLRGANGHLNVNMKARLQLYYVPLRLQPHDRAVPIYQYWSWPHREKYPSTLYVTVKSVLPPEDVEPAVRSMFPTQEEKGTMTAEEVKVVLEGAAKVEATSAVMRATTTVVAAGQSQPAPNIWTRLSGQACKLPNCMALSLPAGKLGCLVVKFSHDGKSLACGCEDKGNYPIHVYEIPSGNLLASFEGHYNTVYELDWSQSDLHLLSASSDGTARIWGVTAKNQEKMLPHPSFVYTAKFHPRVSQVVVTAGYDHLVRVWQIDFRSNAQGQLVQEIDGHTSYVNSICFNEDGDRLYSADCLGIIKMWNVYVTERPAKKGFMQDWTLNRDIIDKEIKGNDISQIYMHPRGNRLVVHTKDNSVRLLDLRVLSVMQRYVGALNFRERVLSDVTPCGTFILSGSEDGQAYVWSTETGDQVATYTQLSYTHTVSDVAFHPHDNLVAFCSHGENHQVLVFKYDAAIADTTAEALYAASGSAARLQRLNAEDDTEDFRVHETKLDSLQKSSSAKSEFTASIDLKKERTLKKLAAISVGTSKEFERQIGKRETGRLSPGDTFSTGRRTADGDAGLTAAAWNSSAWATMFTSSTDGLRQTQSAGAIDDFAGGKSILLNSSAEKRWRPEFSAIGRAGVEPLSMRRTPTIALTPPTPKGSAAMFTFQGAILQGNRTEFVVALYDYKAQKSDELSFARGDNIAVLHKDTENWWIGELPNGHQGYFPVNYVIATGGSAAGSDPAVDTGDGKSSNGSHVTAVVDNKGRLHFLSDDSEDDREETARQNATELSTRTSTVATVSESLAESGHRSRSRERRRNRIASSNFPAT